MQFSKYIMTTESEFRMRRIGNDWPAPCKTIFSGYTKLTSQGTFLMTNLLPWIGSRRTRQESQCSTTPPQFSTSPLVPSMNILEPNGRLTNTEHQRHMSLGLCMHCSQSGHLAQNCPKQSQKPPPNVEAWATWVRESPETSESPKKASADILFLRKSSA